ncbi:MAG: hypothetical protein RMJ56_17145 [Gemmataceae bacterium]|nr:hypothetical protein [Gemmata sp.]MDW8199323.1 hypothetical protein [Gemmataceae bacterium]
MLPRWLPVIGFTLFLSSTTDAAVVVIANYTADPIRFSLAEPEAQPRRHFLGANEVLPFFVRGPADIECHLHGRDIRHRLDVYSAYMFLPQPNGTVEFHGIELPGQPLERDQRPEPNPLPRHPVVKIPVLMAVDDADPRTEQLWQKELRSRFDQAAAAIERCSGIRLELIDLQTWRSDPEAQTCTDLLRSLERTLPAKAGMLVVGYSSRQLKPPQESAFGAVRGVGARHILLREGWPAKEPQRVEVFVHFLARALGAVESPDPGSAMRSKLDDEYILHAKSVLRLDPLNALALNIWAEERRHQPEVELATLSPLNRHRLSRVYRALAAAAPMDAFVRTYVASLEGEMAKKEDFTKDAAAPLQAPERALAQRDALARQILRAIVHEAQDNAQRGPAALRGDSLTARYVHVAAREALNNVGPEMVSAFLIALGIALDDTDTLLQHPDTASSIRNIETEEERQRRQRVLGLPTLAGRRDLCRRFFLGCATGELLGPTKAEEAAQQRLQTDLETRAGFSFPALAAELTGIRFAQSAFFDPDIIRDVVNRFSADDYLPPLHGLRNGLSRTKFILHYGEPDDPRFHQCVADIKKRIHSLTPYRNP